MTNAKLIKCLGTDDSVNSCDCCGRSELKATVAFETESGEVVYFGVVCAAKASGKSSAWIRSEAKVADDAKVSAARIAAEKEHAVRQEKWVAYLINATGGIFNGSVPDVFRMIQALGGYQKATQGFSK
jgi:hypothetical protein